MTYPSVAWDQEANAAYIALRSVAAGESAEQVAARNSSGDVVAVLDFARTGELLGIELLDAAVQLPPSLRKEQ